MTMKTRTVPPMARGIIYAFIHFSLETACYFRLFSAFRNAGDWWTVALAYDALAFVPQVFWGDLTDRKSADLTLPGLAALALSFAVDLLPVSLLLLTAGNAVIHVAGAQYTLRGADGKAAPSGVFVAGGSFGVVAGRMLAKHLPDRGAPISLILLAACAVLVLTLDCRTDEKASGFRDASDTGTTPVILLSALAVCARSYVGYAIPTGWIETDLQTVALFCCMGLGKAAGGFLSDRFGAKRTAVSTLLLSLPFLLCGGTRMGVSLIGIALFSMTMPVTLSALVSVMPDAPGLCFGITTVGLFAGSLPAFFVRPSTPASHIITVTVLTLTAAACCYISCRNHTDKGE